MTKQAWVEHMMGLGLVTRAYRGTPEHQLALEHMRGCDVCQARKRQARANRLRRERDGARRDLGLVKTPYGWE